MVKFQFFTVPFAFELGFRFFLPSRSGSFGCWPFSWPQALGENLAKRSPCALHLPP